MSTDAGRTAEGSEPVTPDILGSAAARLADVMSRGEATLLSGDPGRRAAWMRDVEAAEKEVHAARTAPSWEALLADPTGQPHGVDAVTASVLAYQDALLASACGCGGTIHKGCPRGAATASDSYRCSACGALNTQVLPDRGRQCRSCGHAWSDKEDDRG